MGFLQSDWGITVVLDLFFGGFGAALLVAVTLIDLISKGKHQKTAFVGMWASFACIAAGVLCLLLDVGQPLRAMLMPVSFHNSTSWMTYGAWFMFFAVTFAFLSALIRTSKVMDKVKISDKTSRVLKMCFAVCAIFFGCAVIVYTGCLISAARFIPFWGTPLIPATFIALSLYCGFSAALALYVNFEETNAKALRIGTLIVLALLVVSAVVIAMFATGVGASQLLDGSEGTGYTAVFWALIIVVGLILPACVYIVCLAKQSQQKTLYVIAAIMAGIGGFAWRYLVIAFGVHAPMVALSVKQMFAGFFL